MDNFSRREFIYLSASLPLVFPSRAFAIKLEKNYPTIGYPNTILVLTQAFKTEMMAHRHYVKFAKKALAEKYPNIAYLFHAFSFSEKIHADNYKGINFDFHVCEICGSTIDEEPNSPCQICNRSMSHYKKVDRPT